MFLRLLTDLALFAAAFFIPWWLVVPCAVLCSLGLERAYEIIALGIILDALYGLPIPALGGFRFPFTALCTLIFLVGEFVKPRLRVSLQRENRVDLLHNPFRGKIFDF